MIDLQFNPAAIGWMGTTGLLWDLSGALFLAKSLFFASDEALRRQAGSTYGANPAAVRGFAEQQLDTKFGVTQLAAGFAMQVAAALGVIISPWLALFAVSPLALVWVHYAWNKDYLVARKTLRIGPSPDSIERVWRRNFQEVKQSDWERAKRDSGVTFAEDPEG